MRDDASAPGAPGAPRRRRRQRADAPWDPPTQVGPPVDPDATRLDAASRGPRYAADPDQGRSAGWYAPDRDERDSYRQPRPDGGDPRSGRDRAVDGWPQGGPARAPGYDGRSHQPADSGPVPPPDTDEGYERLFRRRPDDATRDLRYTGDPVDRAAGSAVVRPGGADDPRTRRGSARPGVPPGGEDVEPQDPREADDGADGADGAGASSDGNPAGGGRGGRGGRRTGSQRSGGGGRRGGRSGQQGSFLRELPVILVAALALSLLIKTFLVQAFYIPSESMEDTLLTGDRVFVNKLADGADDIRRGDIVVFRDPGDWLEPPLPPAEPENPVARVVDDVAGVARTGLEFVGLAPAADGDILIKRVIGVENDTVACCDSENRVTVNGVALDEESYLYTGDDPSNITFEVVVPEGHLWMQGDHRSVSADSRVHLGDEGGGFVPEENVVGRAFVLVWPLDRFSRFPRPETFDQPALDAG